jgi:hypothetical protein
MPTPCYRFVVEKHGPRSADAFETDITRANRRSNRGSNGCSNGSAASDSDCAASSTRHRNAGADLPAHSQPAGATERDPGTNSEGTVST